MAGKKWKSVNRERSKTCQECGRTFFINRGESIRAFEFFRKYCGHKCVGSVNSRTMMGKPNLALKDKSPSRKCIDASKLTNSGPNNWNWKGGISKIPGYYTHKALERYARLKGAIGTFSLQEWQELKERYNNSCVNCGTSEMFTKITKDHIVPLTKGGTNYISNIQPLCQHCNSRKNNKLIFKHG